MGREPVPMNVSIWFKRRLKGWRTIIVNLMLSVMPILELTELKAVLPEGWLPWYALGIVAANMILRKITTTPMGQSE